MNCLCHVSYIYQKSPKWIIYWAVPGKHRDRFPTYYDSTNSWTESARSEYNHSTTQTRFRIIWSLQDEPATGPCDGSLHNKPTWHGIPRNIIMGTYDMWLTSWLSLLPRGEPTVTHWAKSCPNEPAISWYEPAHTSAISTGSQRSSSSGCFIAGMTTPETRPAQIRILKHWKHKWRKLWSRGI